MSEQTSCHCSHIYVVQESLGTGMDWWTFRTNESNVSFGKAVRHVYGKWTFLPENSSGLFGVGLSSVCLAQIITLLSRLEEIDRINTANASEGETE